VKITKLSVKNWKNLKNFSIEFSSDALTNVLVGRNGAGKSNLLEAIIIIFRDLDLGEEPAFSYQLEYSCRDVNVQIDADPERARNSINIRVDGKNISLKEFSRKGGGNYLPNYVFGYYSGPSNRMESHFEKHQRQFERDLLAGVDRPLRPLLYARLVHGQFVLLSFFSDKQSADKDFLARYFRILDLDSVLFVLKKPSWASLSRRGSGDKRFWGARGVVQSILDRLYSIALAPLGYRRKGSKGAEFDHFYLFLKDKKDLLSLAGQYENQQEFFKALESTYISDLIEDVRTKVRLKDGGGSLTFRELSEGEQQLLTVLGLLRFTRDNEALFLLDEPDTHLNPSWSLEYLNLLDRVVGKQETSQIIMATHDPLVIAGMLKSEVHIMRRKDDGSVAAEYPDEDPRGMGIAGLLTSEVYGLRSELDIPTMEKLDRKRELVFKSSRTEDEERELARLNNELGELDFTKTARDPHYRLFIEAMERYDKEQGYRVTTLTKDQQKRRQKMADQIIKKLKSDRSEKTETH
jgi:predicted ATPase